jgi:hypothetical protein
MKFVDRHGEEDSGRWVKAQEVDVFGEGKLNNTHKGRLRDQPKTTREGQVNNI